ncbi:MAG TPA: tetratricopeptide repeat protein [Vicinamibacterales bacterium]|nr:tetratricopeptide repeat protein [Vicinamibacterales bacterium]
MPALDEPVGAAAGAKGPALQLSWGRFLLGGGIVLALGGGVWYLTGTDRAGDLPAPPATGLSAAVADHLHQRYATAQQHPSSHVAIGSLCIAYHADMLFDLAERCYARASEIDSSSWRWPYFRALILAERGGGAALVTMLRQLVARSPEFGPAWLRLGDAEFKEANYDAAADAWRRAQQLPEPPAEPGDGPAHTIEYPMAAYASLGLARVALVKDDANRAREILERLTMTSPNFGPGFRLLGDSYRALGREADADRAVYRAGRLLAYSPYADPMMDVLARESRNSTLLLRFASEATLSINAPWSEYLTRRAVEFDPDNPEATLKLARVLRTVDRNDEALAFFKKYQTIVPGDMQVLAHIGSCLSAMGRYGEAETYFRQALMSLDDPVTHYNMGLLLAVTGRLDEAVQEYERALERDPRHGDARGNLAIALVRQGKLDRAVKELGTLLQDDPDNAGAHTNLGLVLLQQGRTDQARAELEAALRLKPDIPQAVEALRSIR